MKDNRYDNMATPKGEISFRNKDSNFVFEDNEQLYLKGLNFFYGINGSINYKGAFECFKKIHENKEGSPNLDVEVLLGIMYEKGLYVAQSYKKAINLYKGASQKGSGKASYQLAQLAENKILDSDEKEEEYDEVAVKYYSISINQGFSDAYARVGLIFEKGLINTKIDIGKAVEHFKKSVEIDGNATGYNGLGNAFYNGNIFKQDYSAAVEHYKKAIYGGNIDALNNLGICYEFGRGVAQDKSKALEYYEKGKNNLNLDATLNYAILKIKIGIQENDHSCFSECFKLLQSSILIKKDNAEAYYYIGLLYEIGFDMFEDGNIIQNIYLAFLNYKKSAELGSVKALTKLGLAIYNGIKGHFYHNHERGIKLLETALQNGDNEAQKYLDYINKNGKLSEDGTFQ